MNLKTLFLNTFKYSPKKQHEFELTQTSNDVKITQQNDINVYKSIYENLEFMKTKYNTLINSDIVIRNFTITINNRNLNAFLIFIDGMVDGNSINSNILKPLLLKNSIHMNLEDNKNNSQIIKKINLDDFIYKKLIPQNSISTETDLTSVCKKINSGFSALFVDKCTKAFCIETKDLKGRTDSEPKNETIIRGSQEAFVENLRTNTGLIRKAINNENLIIENCNIGEITNTQIAICYLSNITNDDLIAEVKYRLNNLKIDSLISSGQLEQLITDKSTIYPEIIATERNDRTCNYILSGRVAILVNGSPYALIVPGIFTDFLTSPEDLNLNHNYGKFLRFIRLVAFIFSIFLPGLYIATTSYHQELIPSELLFAIANARQAIPFPIIFEILLMEISFELIREAGLRVPSPFGQTIGIIGALVLGDAAVTANIVSPILIIVVAFTGLCNFAIPDFSLSFALRIFRFYYIILGYLAGFLGIGIGLFIHFSSLSVLTSFGIPYFTPYIPYGNINKNSNYSLKPMWKREFRSNFLNTKKPRTEEEISMKWKEN